MVKKETPQEPTQNTNHQEAWNVFLGLSALQIQSLLNPTNSSQATGQSTNQQQEVIDLTNENQEVIDLTGETVEGNRTRASNNNKKRKSETTKASSNKNEKRKHPKL